MRIRVQISVGEDLPLPWTGIRKSNEMPCDIGNVALDGSREFNLARLTEVQPGVIGPGQSGTGIIVPALDSRWEHVGVGTTIGLTFELIAYATVTAVEK
jgi:hypothetical protein